MPGAHWFPGARLNFAEHLLGADDDLDANALIALGRRRATGRPDLRRAARAGGAGPRRPAAPRRRAAATGSPPTCRTSRRRSSRSRRRRASARSGRAARRSSARAASSTGSCSSSRQCCWSSAATATATGSIDRRDEIATIRAALPTLRHVVHVPYGRARRADALAWDELLAETGAARVRAGRVRPSALRALLVGNDRPPEGDRARPRRHPAREPEGALVHAGT